MILTVYFPTKYTAELQNIDVFILITSKHIQTSTKITKLLHYNIC